MTWSDETLTAYVDGELDQATRASIDAACAHDPQLTARLERHRALRAAVHASYAPVLDEPVPERLLSLARGSSSASSGAAAQVVDLAAVRATRAAAAPSRWSRFGVWGGALAAAVALGVWIGSAFVGDLSGPPQAFAAAGGKLLARGALAQALDEQLAVRQADAAVVRVGISFVSTEGLYCRTFTLRDASLAGLACKSGRDWRVQVLAQAQTDGEAPGGYRMAGSPLPESVLGSVDRMIQGAPLDADAEVAARQRGWKH